jgi:hypothetical protein
MDCDREPYRNSYRSLPASVHRRAAREFGSAGRPGAPVCEGRSGFGCIWIPYCPSMRTARLSSRLSGATPSLASSASSRAGRLRTRTQRVGSRSPKSPRVGRKAHHAEAPGSRGRGQPISEYSPPQPARSRPATPRRRRSLRTGTPVNRAWRLPRRRAADEGRRLRLTETSADASRRRVADSADGSCGRSRPS